MNPLLSIFQHLAVQELFERILFIWAIRHPASGYVQGINDLVTPFFLVFLSELIDDGTFELLIDKISSERRLDIEIEKFDICSLSESDRRLVEADSFWATSYLLEGIQDNYTFAQPGIQYKLRALEELIKRIDGK
jgi:TBC1 domain family member 2